MNEQLDCTVTGYTVYSISIRVSLCGLLHICYTCYYDSCLHLGGIKKIFIIFFSSKYSWFPKTFLFSQILNYLNVFSCSNLIKMKKGLLYRNTFLIWIRSEVQTLNYWRPCVSIEKIFGNHKYFYDRSIKNNLFHF